MKTIESKLNEYRPVTGFECPAEFWPALGYPHEARYVGIWWELAGDEACWADGRVRVTGADWAAYLALLDHNFKPGHPANWLLGGSETVASFWLIIDRVTEWAWLVPADEADEVLDLQWPAPVAVDAAEDGAGVLVFEDFGEWVAKVREALEVRPSFSPEELSRRIWERAERFAALETALAERKAGRA